MVYSGEYLKEIIFPLGGIGTGSIGICGNGHLMDWEIFNRPNKGSYNGYTHIGIRAEFSDGRSVTKVLQGDWQKDLMGKYSKTRFSGYGYGPDVNTLAGFSHFENAVFDGRFPFATLTFTDIGFPAEVEMMVFNPFIPLDSDNSSIPGGIFDIRVISKEDNVEYTVVFSLKNPFYPSLNESFQSENGVGIILSKASTTKSDIDYGNITVLTSDTTALAQKYWYRGGWNDGICTFWREFSEGKLAERDYSEPGEGDTCSLASKKLVSSGETGNFRFILSWNVPNCYNYWSPCYDSEGNHVTWKNYYATIFPTSRDSAEYLNKNYEMLLSRTEKFNEALFSSTLEPCIIEAVSATLTVLNSATVMRLEDGTFYGWEGLHETEGSCEGTCCHVWSYAYALCFLFPELERSIRLTEYRYSMKKTGGIVFRSKLPIGIDSGDFRPCVDGQMATVFKTYREWKLSGDDEWLKSVWESVKKSLAFAWSDENTDLWDNDRDGVLEGRQHHTLDMELFGPSSWLEGMYLAALKAAYEMARYLSDLEAENYLLLFEKGKKWMNENLFNGKYFFQKVDVNDKRQTELYNCPDYWNSEAGELKYQIAGGCEIDQMLAQWHADIIGLGDIFDVEKKNTALEYMMKNNFKQSLRGVDNIWRNFALNDESGTIICDYSDAKKPMIAVPYSEECMTGFEYAFAGLLISSGYYNDGIKVISAIRERYDGKKRNPFNEIECGSHYARSMASFALIPIISGFEFDLPNRIIGFTPIKDGYFKTLWFVGSGWGSFVSEETFACMTVNYGEVSLKRLKFGKFAEVSEVVVDGKRVEFSFENNTVVFEKEVTVNQEINIKH